MSIAQENLLSEQKYDKKSINTLNIIAVAASIFIGVYISLSFTFDLVKRFYPDDFMMPFSQFSIILMVFNFIMMPVGALSIGSYADIKGRKAAMILATIVMALATAIIIFLPSYNSIGTAASIIYTIGSNIQSIAFGGIFVAGIAYLLESAPHKLSGVYTSLALVAVSASYFFTSVTIHLIYTFFSIFSEWATILRFSFIFTFVFILLLLALYMHYYLQDNFVEDSAQKINKKIYQIIQNIMVDIFKGYWMWFLIGLSMLCGFFFMLYFNSYYSYYVFKLRINPQAIAISDLARTALMVVFVFLAGLCIDRYGCYKTIIVPLLVFLVLFGPVIYLFNITHDAYTFYLVTLLCAVLPTINFVGIIALVCKNFPKHIRVTAIFLLYSLGFGILKPILFMRFNWLQNKYNTFYLPISYLLFANILCLIAVYLAYKKTTR